MPTTPSDGAWPSPTASEYLYEPGSFVPLAKLESEWKGDGAEKSGPNPLHAADFIEELAIENIANTSERPKTFTAYYYQCDQIGAPQELTDEQGRIVWAASYKVWGETQALQVLKTGTDGSAVFTHADRPLALAAQGDIQALSFVEQPLRFQGQYADGETGLHYNRFRYYDPVIGRFVHQDPVGLEGGANLFRYGINPITWIDPLGLKYRSGTRSPHVVSGKDKPNNSTQQLSEWRRSVCMHGIKDEMKKFLGDEFVKVEEGKWRSIDGTRRFRVTPGDYSGAHGMGSPNIPNTPHVHFEFFTPKPTRRATPPAISLSQRMSMFQ
ncbi:RHS repeat-associated core domain-containing protein [Paracidovorax konjaci]|uniref:RHS repeat-associated core domain-containing protein n=1 Tax=Paracidovorax konjaci TaxID=32040 RepID=A0A1I1SLH7_9BURK|nr:RHS repeat-associated core domain-containing protein [Paracidovorax konjaci]SFD47261.1 RHS repeat-associated core domain-containing protein [Paracidovorax konjaci]